jgi:uroporphyrinogen-III synthase
MLFDGLRVLSFESRRSEEMAALIRKQGGEPFVAPSMREVPLDRNEDALLFGRQLLAGVFDCCILLTGVGTRLLWSTLLTKYSESELKAAFTSVTLVVRGPKPSGALRDLGIIPDVLVPEPNTWRELLETMRARPEKRLAVQEYGKSNPQLIAGLREQGREVFPVRVYGWDMPEDTRPLRQAAARLIAGQVDAVLFTTSLQVVNLFKIADEDGITKQVREGLQSAFIGSIGPSTTETLEDYGINPDFEPSHPKMGLLVNESAGQAAAVLKHKR